VSRLLIALIAALSAVSPAVSAVSAVAPAWADQWVWPVAPPPGRSAPVVLSGFDPPAERWQSGRRGVLLAAPPGAVVRAAGAGTVVYAGQLFGRGVVAVSHGDVRTTYLPVTPTVHQGDRVLAGTPIGRLQQPSDASQPSGLHWGLVTGHGHDVRYLDPLALLGVGVVRLLPIWSGPGALGGPPLPPVPPPPAPPLAPSVPPRASPADGLAAPWAGGAAGLPVALSVVLPVATALGVRRLRGPRATRPR
jgi:hypothetical protein